MRLLVVVSFVLAFLLVASVGAQQPDPPASLESLRVALQKSQRPAILIPSVPPWVAPEPKSLGILTLVPPDTNGEMVKVVVPVGDIMSRAAHAVSNVRHRRAERKAQEKVLRDLQDFLAQRPPP